MRKSSTKASRVANGGRSALTIERTLAEIIGSEARSRSDLTVSLEASKASISRLVDRLIRRGWVSEGAPVRVAERGRNATTLLVQRDLGYAIGADLEGFAIRVCLFDCQRNVIKSRKRLVDPEWSPERIIAQWRSLIVDVIESAGVPREKLIGLGLALPWIPVDGAEEVRSRLTAGSLVRFNVSEALGDIGVPIVASDNTLCVSDYERRFGVATGEASFASILVRFGVGAAVYHRGRFVVGEDSPCSELGHVRVAQGGEACICGATGCLDPLVSGRTWSPESGRTGASWERELAERAHHLGVGIAHLLKIIYTPLVVLNGVYNAYEDRVGKEIRESLAAELDPHGLPVPEVRMGDQLEYKACIGAGLRAIDQRLDGYLAGLDTGLDGSSLHES